MTIAEELIQEALTRGFVKGCEYRNLVGDVDIADQDATVFSWEYDNGHHGRTTPRSLMCSDGRGLIYKQGKWGEVIKYAEGFTPNSKLSRRWAYKQRLLDKASRRVEIIRQSEIKHKVTLISI